MMLIGVLQTVELGWEPRQNITSVGNKWAHRSQLAPTKMPPARSGLSRSTMASGCYCTPPSLYCGQDTVSNKPSFVESPPSQARPSVIVASTPKHGGIRYSPPSSAPLSVSLAPPEISPAIQSKVRPIHITKASRQSRLLRGTVSSRLSYPFITAQSWLSPFEYRLRDCL